MQDPDPAENGPDKQPYNGHDQNLEYVNNNRNVHKKNVNWIFSLDKGLKNGRGKLISRKKNLLQKSDVSEEEGKQKTPHNLCIQQNRFPR